MIAVAMRMSLETPDASTLRPGCLRSTLRTRGAAARSGFTIMELAVVLLVMGIVAAVAVPSFYRSLQFHEVDTAARRVVLDLEQARHSAKLQSIAWSMAFSDDGRYALFAPVVVSGQPRLKSLKSLRSPDEADEDFANLSSLLNSNTAYSVDLADSPYHLDDVVLDLANASVTNTGEIAITFDGYGNTATSGTIRLTRGDSTRTVTLNGPAGTITYTNP